MPTNSLFTVGDRVITTAPIDYLPHACLAARETGTVVDVFEGTIEVRLDKHHAGLDQWQNRILIDDLDTITITNARTAIVPMVRETIIAVLRSPWRYVAATVVLDKLGHVLHHVL